MNSNSTQKPQTEKRHSPLPRQSRPIQVQFIYHQNPSPKHSRSRSITKRVQYASPSAQRPNMHMPRMDSSLRQSAHFSHSSIVPVTILSPTRQIQSSHTGAPLINGSEKSIPSAPSYLRNRSESGDILCSNNDGKKARYMLRENTHAGVFCAKCSIELVERGEKIQEIGLNAGRELETRPKEASQSSQKDKLIDVLAVNVQTLSGRLKMSVDGIENRKAEINSLCSDMHSQLQEFYEKLKKTIQQSKQADFKRIENLKSTCIMLLQAHQKQAQQSTAKLHKIRQELQALKALKVDSGSSEQQFRGKMAGFADRIINIEVYLQQSTQQMKFAMLPTLRAVPIWDGNIFTFLQAPKISSPVEFSFVGPRIQVVSQSKAG